MHKHYNCVSRTASRPVKGVGLLPLSSVEQWIKSKTVEYNYDPMKQNVVSKSQDSLSITCGGPKASPVITEG